MEGNFVVEAVCSSLDLSVEEARELLFDNDGQAIARLKVNELKDIIRDLKAQGYNKVNLSVTANKAGLVAMLQAVSAAERINGIPPLPAASKAAPVAPTPQLPPVTPATVAPLPRNLHAQLPIPAPATGPRAIQQPLPIPAAPLSPPPQHHMAQPKPKSSTKKAQTPHKPVSNHPGHLYTPKAGDDPNMKTRLLSVLSNAQKIQAYKILKQVPGVTEKEILDELETIQDNVQLDVDEVMFSIVTKRESATPSGHSRHLLGGEGEVEEEELDELQEQENRDLDMAIRESEKERDVIQQRKRARTEALKQGQEGMLTCQEYEYSVLLFGCRGCTDSSGGDSGSGNSDVEGSGDEVEGGVRGGGSGGSSGSSGSSGGCKTASAATLTKETFLHTTATLHRAGTHTSTQSDSSSASDKSHGSNKSNGSHTSYTTSSYSYSSDEYGTSGVSTAKSASANIRATTSTSARIHTNSSSGISGSSGSCGINGTSKRDNSAVVDLTLDTDSESEHIVHKNTSHSAASSCSGGNGGACRTLTNSSNSSSSSSAGGQKQRVPSTHTATSAHPNYSTNQTTNITNTTNTTITTNAANTAKPTSTATKANMSRSKVIYSLAKLLDSLHSTETTTNSNTNTTTATSGNTVSTSSSSSSSSTSYTTSTTSSTTVRPATTTTTATNSSSTTLTTPVNLHNHVYNLTALQYCPPHCITLLTSLRTVLSRLLLLEANATKYYKNTSTAYMVHTARRIDGKLLCGSVDQAINNNTANTTTNTNTNANTNVTTNASTINTNTTHNPDDCIYHLPTIHAYIRHTTLLTLLTHESDKLEKGMYKLQTDGSLVPYIFKKPRLAYYARVLAANIDSDGMEVLDTVNGNNNTCASSSNSSSGIHTHTTNNVIPNTDSAIIDCSMMDSSEESVASEYNSDEDDF